MFELKPEILTSESFAAYGRVMEHTDCPCTKQGEGWTCYSPIDFMLPDVPMGIGVVYCQEFPKAVNALERHVSREELLWATTEDLVMAVDIPIYMGDEHARPKVETTKVFIIKAGQAVIINRGTWHSPAFAVNGKSKYFFLIERKSDLIDQDAQPWIPFVKDECIAVAY